MKVKERLKVLRVEKGVTLREAAEQIGIGKSSLGAYEKGITKPSEEVLAAIARYYEVPVSELLKETTEERIVPAETKEEEAGKEEIREEDPENAEKRRYQGKRYQRRDYNTRRYRKRYDEEPRLLCPLRTKEGHGRYQGRTWMMECVKERCGAYVDGKCQMFVASK